MNKELPEHKSAVIYSKLSMFTLILCILGGVVDFSLYLLGVACDAWSVGRPGLVLFAITVNVIIARNFYRVSKSKTSNQASEDDTDYFVNISSKLQFSKNDDSYLSDTAAIIQVLFLLVLTGAVVVKFAVSNLMCAI